VLGPLVLEVAPVIVVILIQIQDQIQIMTMILTVQTVIQVPMHLIPTLVLIRMEMVIPTVQVHLTVAPVAPVVIMIQVMMAMMTMVTVSKMLLN
jgi:hypothetical protein